jgi:parallel beta-helix repeat protein
MPSFDNVKLLARLIALGIVVLVVGQAGLVGSTQECSVTLSPGQPIQSAINQAQAGAVICLAPGTWDENLVIAKPLTLRGAGKEQTVISGAVNNKIILQIGSEELVVSPEVIKVKIEDLKIAEGKGCEEFPTRCALGIAALGRVEVTITNVQISNNEGSGIGVCCLAQVTIFNSHISRNSRWSVGIYGPAVIGPPKVTIQNSQISGSFIGIAMGLEGSAQVTVQNSQISGNRDGLWVAGSNQVTLTDTAISGNELRGLLVWGSATVSLQNSTISGNELHGLLVLDSATVSLQNSTISGNELHGLLVSDSATVSLQNSTISGNRGDGLVVRGSAIVSLQNSIVSGNGEEGLIVWDSATVEVRGSTLEGNGTDPDCQKPNWICSGIAAMDQSQMVIIDSRIINNTDWGVAASLEKCGYGGNYFVGKVVFEGHNVIEGNNKSGNQNGMGNPGNHPWNRPGVPDGQVCLP